MRAYRPSQWGMEPTDRQEETGFREARRKERIRLYAARVREGVDLFELPPVGAGAADEAAGDVAVGSES